MGKILAVDDDHATLTLIEGALALAGHDTLITAEPTVLSGLLESGPIDALILDINMPQISGFDILRQLREQPRWRTLPVLLISAETGGDTRARGLRDGADDFLAKPFVADELIASIERMMARQSSDTGLQGSLERFPAPELLQYLAAGTKTGFLEIARRGRPAEILFRDGLVVAATAGNLTGREAVLEALCMTEGFFHFEFDDRPSTNAPRVKIDLQSALFESAWLEDELEKRRDSVPASDQPLVVLDHQFQCLEDFEELPAAQLHQMIGTHPGTRLEDLQAAGVASTVKVTLAATMMVTSGVVAFAPREDPAIFRELFEIFVARSLDPKSVHLLVITSPQVWEGILGILQKVPEKLLPTQSDHLFEQLRQRGQGTLRLGIPDHGSVIFHLLPAESGLRIDPAVLKTVAGVLAWTTHPAPAAATEILAELDAAGSLLRPDAIRVFFGSDAPEGFSRWMGELAAPESIEDVVRAVKRAPASP